MNAATRPGLLTLSILLGASSIASADIAPPRPEELSCPRGSIGAVPTVRSDATDDRGRPVQPWPYCAASTCASDSDCGGGRVCSTDEIGLCVETQEVPGGEPVRRVRERGCEPDGSCLNLQSTCERARRCVTPDGRPPSAPPPAEGSTPAPGDETETSEAPAETAAETSASGCACHATGRTGRSGLAGVAALFALAWWGLGRRLGRRRARRRG